MARSDFFSRECTRIGTDVASRLSCWKHLFCIKTKARIQLSISNRSVVKQNIHH